MLTGQGTPTYQDTEITNDGFWPNLNAGDFERRRSTPMAQDAENIQYAIVAAIDSCNIELELLKADYLENGINSAADVTTGATIAGKNALCIQYERAVFARAKADLLPDFATVHQRDAGKDLAERSQETKNELLAESNRIIRNMYGKTRSTVTMI
ncbi:head completion/stabilization protein [Vibrio algicola]|uniref:Head protein n=1 Tax=Vibrio algicola TaxID=2662262 RepID=A0A5Q0TF30_9VIBR|nr:head completion/stabilization protein [Vibrio algicola]